MLNELEKFFTHWMDHGLKHPDVNISIFGCIFSFHGGYTTVFLIFESLWQKHGSEVEVANKKELSGAPLVTSRCEGAMQAALLVFYPVLFVLTFVGAQVSDF